MHIPQVNIKIGAYIFDYVHEYSIDSSWEELTDKGRIVLPANLTWNSYKLKEVIEKGAEVSIEFGYDGNMQRIFTGFVSAVSPSVPVVIEVEDLMWKLKQTKISAVAKNETILDFCKRVMPGYEFDGFDIELPTFIANKITGAKLLDQIKSDFGLRSFVRNGVIVIGKQYDAETANEVIFSLGENIKSDSLEYKSKDDVKLNITAISNMASGQKHEVVIGDEDGESRTLNFFNIPKADLQKIAEKEAERLIYDGFRGSFIAFGEPFVKHGDIVDLRDSEDTDKQGRYFVDAVTYTGGVNGFTQVIKLGGRAS